MTSAVNQTISPHAQELNIIRDASRPSDDIALSSEHFPHPSDPNTVLTNPEIQKHLRLLHERAKKKGDTVIVDDVKERRQLLMTKLNAYNRRSEVGAFKVKISESLEDLTYSGPITFYYQAVGSNREICRVVSLSDRDCVRTILPELCKKFKVVNDIKCTLREMINGDEILLDPDDRPLELAVNSKSPVSFHLVAGSDRNSELLRNLQSEHFSPKQRRKLIKKYNLSSEEVPSPVSTISTPRHQTSLNGSSANGSLHLLPPETNYYSISPATGTNHTMAKENGQNDVRRKSSLKETSIYAVTSSPKAKHTRSNSMPKNDNSSSALPKYSYATLGSRVKRPPPTTNQAHNSTNSSSRTGRVRQVKHKKDGGLGNRRPSRSASARKLFRSLRKYRGRSSSRERRGSRPSSGSEDEDAASAKNSELSSDANLPGILKIFGDHVSPGANYKSVMATTNSTAKELVKIALERYGLSRQEACYHVLCEVVGKFKENNNSKGNPKGLKIKAKKNKKQSGSSRSLYSAGIGATEREFKEDYARPLTDQEKPLVLQSYWKPQDGLCRRFEIRRKSKVFTKTVEDHSTRDINSQAKRLMQKSKTTPNLHSVSRLPLAGSESEDEKITSFDDSFVHDDQAKTCDKNLKYQQLPDRHDKVASQINTIERKNDENKTSADSSVCDVIKTLDRVTPDGVASKVETATDTISPSSPPSPYLITLQGNEDTLIHSLDKQEVLIGSDVTDFKLVASDVQRHHCVIKKRLEVVFSEQDNYEAVKRWSVTINPLNPAAEVRINGGRITSKHSLQHGEMLSVGKHHLFMYKDPSSHINLSSLVNLSFLQANRDSDNCSTEAHGSNTSLNTAVSPRNQADEPPKLTDHIKTLLSYPVEREDEILQDIFNYISNFDNNPHKQDVLFPATLLCHCIVYSCLNFDLRTKNDLLLKVASTMQTLVLNATRKVSVHEVQTIPASESNAGLISSLRHVVFWMSNSLEVFGFLQNDLEPILKQKVTEEKEKGTVNPELLELVEQFEVNEEILALMEEVVMYAFQQLVYYLTKTLYGCLPAILESNPFADDESNTLNVTQITQVFAQARQMMLSFDVNQRISEQLFAYLFFFTNVSLFNTLMEEGSSKYYKWEMGVRIRGNLEYIEAWADENGCMGQCMKHLEKISAIANLLATPRGQFLKGSWLSFRQNFPALAPAQLRKLLTGYHISGSQSKPSSWNPTTDELSEAFNTDLILESYDNHPPLMLPVSGCRLNLQVLPEDPTFYGFYERIQEKGAQISDEHVMAGNLDTSRRERPDGRELSKTDDAMALSNHEVVLSQMKKLKIADAEDKTEHEQISLSDHDKANYGTEKNVLSPSECSTSSEPEAYVIHKQVSEANDGSTNNDEPLGPSTEKISQVLDSSPDDVDELVVLPVVETSSLVSHVSSNIGSPLSSSSSISSIFAQDRAAGMPKEVFIVDIKRGRTGLGVGLIDGLATSFAVAGVYVRSLIPDNPTTKHSPTKHHDVIRCWLQEGRLQLGDRILAANGVSLVNMSYYEAIKTVKHAGDKVRLLVGRCGNEVAAKITSST